MLNLWIQLHLSIVSIPDVRDNQTLISDRVNIRIGPDTKTSGVSVEYRQQKNKGLSVGVGRSSHQKNWCWYRCRTPTMSVSAGVGFSDTQNLGVGVRLSEVRDTKKPVVSVKLRHRQITAKSSKYKYLVNWAILVCNDAYYITSHLEYLFVKFKLWNVWG